ncbi:MAG: methyltransferase [Pseudomonadota bacterium]|nr:methyltransferase [Pseudomonadota bacterium]
MTFRPTIAATVALSLAMCAGAATAAPKPGIPGAVRAGAPKFAEDGPLIESIAGAWRPAAEKARDKYRHPLETLTFWGLRPGSVVVDLQPGGGYWTQIIAPYERITGGRYIAGVADLANPKMSEGGKKGREAFAAKFADEKIYGKVELANFGAVSAPFAPAGTVDLVITSRELHNWAPGGKLDKIMGDAFAALKPGGFLAVEDHRADPRPEVAEWKDGYIATKTVIEAAKKAGFVLDASSEINANPKDTKDHPFGVWTLPPSRQSSGTPDSPAATDAKFDHAKYDAIGESDRMTLRFKKPG